MFSWYTAPISESGSHNGNEIGHTFLRQRNSDLLVTASHYTVPTGLLWCWSYKMILYLSMLCGLYDENKPNNIGWNALVYIGRHFGLLEYPAQNVIRDFDWLILTQYYSRAWFIHSQCFWREAANLHIGSQIGEGYTAGRISFVLEAALLWLNAGAYIE